jgi:hypothetical protein
MNKNPHNRDKYLADLYYLYSNKIGECFVGIIFAASAAVTTVRSGQKKSFLVSGRTGKALDPHMADQLFLYLALCKEESVFTTSCISGHLMTNLWVIEQFHEFKYNVAGEIGDPGTVQIALNS